MDSPALREAYNAALPRISQYWTELGQNLQLFQKYKELARSAEFAGGAAAACNGITAHTSRTMVISLSFRRGMA